MFKQEDYLTFGIASICAFAIGFATIAGVNVFNEIQLTTAELNAEMFGFKEASSELWKELLAASASLDAKALRERRQSYSSSPATSYFPTAAVEAPPPKVQPEAPVCNCQTEKENKCPRGPPGVKGEKGAAGANGADGSPGLAGRDVDDVEAQQQDYGTDPEAQRECAEAAGFGGRDGNPGEVGPQGPIGATGEKGPIGRQGRAGRDVRVLIGQPGKQGPKGDVGPIGEPGLDGLNAPNGQELPDRKASESLRTSYSFRAPGKRGKNGAVGLQGDAGAPGADAIYCPCPPRTANHYPTA
ncbi:hypothetical protein M3Y99_00915400 [Aphelenchoides fujianensis]|nr:hypothetical protein M3Y99_00915400 [Aphelenchoides fujianensis]